MSATGTETGEVARLTVGDSSCSPLCQVLRFLCHSPVCYTVSRHLRGVQGRSQSLLGTLQVMGGLLTVGLGAIVCPLPTVWIFPLWLGAVYIFFGIVCILSEKFPSPCLVLLSAAFSLLGSLFAATAVVMFSINLGVIDLWDMCEPEFLPDYVTEGTPGATPVPQWAVEKCLEGKATILVLLRGIISVLLVLSMQQLCVSISSAVLGIKALRSRQDGDHMSGQHPQEYKAPTQWGGSDPTA